MMVSSSRAYGQPARFFFLEKEPAALKRSSKLQRPARGDCSILLLRISRKNKQKKRRSEAPLKSVTFA
jgi:hypothetical protein